MANDTEQRAKTLQKLESRVFDKKTINSLPFEFFNLLAKAISRPQGSDQLEIPKVAEIYFRDNKRKEAATLFKFLNENAISNGEKSFIGSYLDLMISRYRIAFASFAEYALRRIPTTQEHGLINEFKVNNVPYNHYVAISIDSIVPKLQNGEINFEKLQEQEKKESKIASLFSVINSTPETAGLIREYFEDITDRSIFPVVYNDELSDLIIDITQELLFYFGNLVYKNLRNKIPLREVIDNLKDYYMRSTNPARYRFSADLDQFEVTLTETINAHLNNMDQLTKESKNDIQKELIESVLKIIETGFALPTYYYEVNLRDANKLDQADYNVRYAADFQIYDENFNKLKYIYETYGFVVDVKSMSRILRYTFNNQKLYKRFLELS